MDNAGGRYKVIVDPAANDRICDHFSFMSRISESAAKRLLGNLVEDMNSFEIQPYHNPALTNFI